MLFCVGGWMDVRHCAAAAAAIAIVVSPIGSTDPTSCGYGTCDRGQIFVDQFSPVEVEPQNRMNRLN